MSADERYAGLWIRLVADLIDTTVLSIVSWVLELMVLGAFYWFWSGYLGLHGNNAPPFADAFNSLKLQLLNLGIYVCVAFPYYVWGHYKWGTTVGKVVFRIYVVSKAGRGPLTLRQSIIRFFAYGLSYLPICAGFLMAGFHPEKRALHDLLAGTVSVRR